jgi:hypothetical protein
VTLQALIAVDDGSPDGAAIAAVTERFGAKYVRRFPWLPSATPTVSAPWSGASATTST